jgi:6,7-dimethyl-8-ribityllumazine synthase
VTEHWPGEERIAATEQHKLGPEVPEDEVEAEPGEEEPGEEEPAAAAAEAEVPPADEQIENEQRDGDTPAREEEEAPAEEDELPRLRTPGHADGGLSIPDGYGLIEGSSEGSRNAVGIVVSRFNADVTNRLLESALDELELAGILPEAVTIVPVPGAFELPIALGCVIRGETPHFDYIAGEAASGLQLAGLETGVPVSFGVLTLESAAQAEARIEKGADAVRSALEMADLFSQLRTAATSG